MCRHIIGSVMRLNKLKQASLWKWSGTKKWVKNSQRPKKNFARPSERLQKSCKTVGIMEARNLLSGCCPGQNKKTTKTERCFWPYSWLCQKLLLCFHISVQTLKSTQRKVSFILLGVQTSNNKQQTCKTFNQRLLLKRWATLHQTKTNTSMGWKELEQMHRLVQTPGPYPAVTSADVCS